MNTFIVLGVPKGFPCQAAALHALRAAMEAKKDRIRIEQPGCVCEFDVAALYAHYRAHRPFGDSFVRAGSISGHRAFGNLLEPRGQTWPGFSRAHD